MKAKDGHGLQCAIDSIALAEQNGKVQVRTSMRGLDGGGVQAGAASAGQPIWCIIVADGYAS